MLSTYGTADGGTVHVYPMGPEIELEYRAANGDTEATVRMSRADALELLRQLDSLGVGAC